jgi:diguanylate cyclase (GGDEF)-like protein
MFGWFKNKGGDDESAALATVPTNDPDAPRDDYETALETVGSMLRSIARGAFTNVVDTAEDLSRRFEDWAQHILIQTPPPDRPLEEGDENRSFPRDWLALRRIVTDHRRREHDYVVETVGGLRGAVWAFVDSLHRVMTMVAASDKQVGSNLERLKDVARGGSPEMLQREVMSVVREIETVIDDRQKKQRSQTRDLGSRIRNVSHQLSETRSPASIDTMTRLFNKKSVEEHLQQLIELSDLFEQQVSIAYFDIDGMRTINEAYGQPTGDLLLRKLADMVARAFPQRTDFAARYDGDAFLVVQNETPLKDARRLAERFMQQARVVHVKRGDREVHATFSGGLAQLEPGESAKGFIDRTARAARRAYDGGGDRVLDAGPAIVEPKDAG